MADSIEVKVAEIEQRAKGNSHRLDKVEERQDNLDKLVSSVEVLATKQETVENDVKDIKKDVRTLTEKPGKRWETVMGQIVSLFIAAIVGFILAKIGIKI